MRLLNHRIASGWYYPWDLGYNNCIDWTRHPGESC